MSEIVDGVGVGREDEHEDESEDCCTDETAFHLLAHVVQAAPVENEVAH